MAMQAPPTRNRYVDFLRALSILAVVVGHWLVAAPDMQAAATARAKVKLRAPDTKIAVKVGGVGAKVEVNTGGIKAKVGTTVKTTKDAVIDKGKSIKSKIRIKLGGD